MDFIKALQDSSLSDPSLGMSPEAVRHLHNPSHNQPGNALNANMWLTIDLYLGNTSEATYKTNQRAILCCFLNIDIPSYYKTKWLVTELTGVESVVHHMCAMLPSPHLAPDSSQYKGEQGHASPTKLWRNASIVKALLMHLWSVPPSSKEQDHQHCESKQGLSLSLPQSLRRVRLRTNILIAPSSPYQRGLGNQ